MQNDVIPGTVFRARQHPNLLVFVPDSYFLPGSAPMDFSSFDQETFLISRWPGLNARANYLESATVLLPDFEDLLPEQASAWEDFRKFTAALQRAIADGD